MEKTSTQNFRELRTLLTSFPHNSNIDAVCNPILLRCYCCLHSGGRSPGWPSTACALPVFCNFTVPYHVIPKHSLLQKCFTFYSPLLKCFTFCTYYWNALHFVKSKRCITWLLYHLTFCSDDSQKIPTKCNPGIMETWVFRKRKWETWAFLN